MNKLNSIAEIRIGYNIRHAPGAEAQDVKIISARDLSTNFTNPSSVNIPRSYDGYLEDGDVLVKSRGDSYEAKVFQKPDPNLRYIAANTLILVRLNTKDYTPTYIAQMINSNKTQCFLRSLSSGQTIPILSPASLGLIDCPKISMEKQAQIESIAKTINDYQTVMARYQDASKKLSGVLQRGLIKEQI